MYWNKDLFRQRIANKSPIYSGNISDMGVYNDLVGREVALDRANRHTNPWLVFVSEFFAQCRKSDEKPWQNTGISPMAFAGQVYQERQAMQDAFIENGMWEPETLQVPDPSFVHVDPDQVFCEVDWDDHVSYQAAA